MLSINYIIKLKPLSGRARIQFHKDFEISAKMKKKFGKPSDIMERFCFNIQESTLKTKCWKVLFLLLFVYLSETK
jgi:hypothetical protein